MLLSRYSRLLKQTSRSRKQGAPGAIRRRSYRPYLEILESRLTPAPVAWISASSGDWATPGNWSTGQLPGPADDVTINVSGVTVTHSTGTDSIHSLVSSDPLTLSGGSLAVNGSVQVSNTFSLAGGTLNYDFGTTQINVNGPLNLNGAALSITITSIYNARPGASFAIVHTTGGVHGTFKGLAEGASLVGGGVPFTISYQGNGGKDVTLTVGNYSAPVFTSAASTTFVTGTAASFSVTAYGFPTAGVIEIPTDTLPKGITFRTTLPTLAGLLSGTPAAGSAGTYTLHFIATSPFFDNVEQVFTLHVGQGDFPVTVSTFTATAGTLQSVTVATFTVSDHTIPASSFSAAISWGDNQTSVVPVSGDSGSFTVSASHTYAQAGPYQLAVTVTQSTPSAATASGFGLVHVARSGLPPSWLAGFASDLTHSAEYCTLIVTAAYGYLGRAPDSMGLAGWVTKMQQGLSDEHLEAKFVGSDEFINQHGGAGAGWVKGMYRVLLYRDPTQSEIDGWVQKLNGGESTTDIAYGFAASTERERQRVTADYLGYLGRTPTTDERDGWVSSFANGTKTNEDVVAGFVGSTEYFQKDFGNVTDWFAGAFQALFGRSADQAGAAPSYLPALAGTLTHSAEYYTLIVTAAYQRYLGRPPDSAGLAGWVAKMQQGFSDEHLEANFIGSDEYINHHGGAGAGWVQGMYHDLLGRPPAQSEVDGWVQKLNGGESTTDIAYGFAASTERERQRVTADYLQYLGRTPTTDERDGWVTSFENGSKTNEDVVAGFVGSTEYFQKYKGDPLDWLNQAVLALFGPAGF